MIFPQFHRVAFFIVFEFVCAFHEQFSFCYFFLKRCQLEFSNISFHAVSRFQEFFFRHSIKFCIPNRRKIDGTWSLLYEKPGKLSRSTFKCRRMFTVEALWKQGQRRKLIKHRHEVPAVQRFYENASADRSRSGALLMIPQSFINSIRLINVLV